MKVAKRVDFKYPHHKKGMELCDLMEVLPNARIVIILQNMCIKSTFCTSLSYTMPVMSQ